MRRLTLGLLDFIQGAIHALLLRFGLEMSGLHLLHLLRRQIVVLLVRRQALLSVGAADLNGRFRGVLL